MDPVNNILRQITQPIGNIIAEAFGHDSPQGFLAFLFVDQPIVLLIFLIPIIVAAAYFTSRRRAKRKKAWQPHVSMPSVQVAGADPPSVPPPQITKAMPTSAPIPPLALSPQETNEGEHEPWEQAIFLEKNEKIVDSWTGNWQGSGEIAVRATKKAGAKQRQMKMGLLALTNQRLVFLEEHGVFGKSYHQVLTIPLTNLNGVSMGGKYSPFVSIAAGEETNVFHLNGVGNSEFEQFRGLIADACKNRKEEAEAEKKKERVQIVIDFSTLTEHMQKGGLILQKTKCPACGAPIAIPTAGKQTICQHCGSTILAQDIFEKIKDLI